MKKEIMGVALPRGMVPPTRMPLGDERDDTAATEPEWIARRVVEEMLRCSRANVRRLVENQLILARRNDQGHWLFRRTEVEMYARLKGIAGEAARGIPAGGGASLLSREQEAELKAWEDEMDGIEREIADNDLAERLDRAKRREERRRALGLL